ncbi:MAG: hypothetical protein V4527_14660 [Pseudomonadota bacterium]
MVDDVIPRIDGFADDYVSPASHQIISYVTARTGERATYFLKRLSARFSAVPKRRKFVALWYKKTT